MPRDEANKAERKRMRAAAKMERKLKRRHKRSEARAELNAMREQLDLVTRTLVRHISLSNRRYRSVVLTTQLPIVAGVVYKEMFRIGMGRAQTNISFVDTRQNLLLEQYTAFGMHSGDEMRKFVDTVSSCSTTLMMY